MLKQIINQDESPDGGEPREGETAGKGEASKSKVSSFPSSMTSKKNILSSDVEIKGKLRFESELIVDGRIEGEVNSEGDLTVGENARIVGNINTRTVVVFGKVQGNISVTDRCELKQNASLHGDVVAAKLAIEEGAVFMGSSAVGDTASATSSKPSSRSSDSGGGDDSEGQGG